MPPIEVFLSHSSLDQVTAGRVAHVLGGHGVPVFYSAENILGAQQWQNEILDALQRCDWFIVLLSPDAIDSMWVKREVAFALNDARYEDRIVPLSYRECDLESMRWLTLFENVDLTGDFEAGCRDLLQIWGIEFDAQHLPP